MKLLRDRLHETARHANGSDGQGEIGYMGTFTLDGHGVGAVALSYRAISCKLTLMARSHQN